MSVEQTTLSNGVRVISDCFNTVETAAVGIWVNAGSRHETAAENGIAHLLEHMAFKGTVSRDAQQIVEQIEDVGGYLNADTSREITGYHARIMAQDFPLAADIITDILQNSTFDAEEFIKEQDVVIQEIGQSKDEPHEVAYDYFHEVCFPNQALGRPILGTEPIIKSLTPDNVKNFMKTNYGANRFVFAAAGNLQHDQIVRIAESLLSDLKIAPEPQIHTPQYEGGIKVINRETDQAHTLIGFPGLSAKDPNYHAQSLLSTMLGSGMSSRLFQEIREKRGLASSVYSFFESYRDIGMFGIYAGTAAEKVSELISVIGQELTKFLKGFDDKELQRAKAQLKAGLVMGMERTSSRCERIGRQLHILGQFIPIPEVVRRIEAVDQATIVNLAAEMFSKKPTIVTVGQVETLPSLVL